MKCLLLLFLLLPFALTAQTERILTDTSVTWAAAFELILPVDPLDIWEEEGQKLAEMAVLKLQSDDTSLSRYVHYALNGLIWENLGRGDRKYFADAALTLPLTFDEVVRIIGAPDTVTTFDPETYEEKKAIVWDAHFFPAECPLLRTRQLLIYHDAEVQFDIVTLAIAPAQPDGSVQFWMQIPADKNPDSIDLRSPEINWAVRYVTQTSSIGDFQVLKGGDIPIMERLFERVRNDTTIALYFRKDEAAVSPTHREGIFISQSMVCVQPPGTFDQEFRLVQSEIKPSDVRVLELIEEWIWDRERQIPAVRLRGIAPVIVEYETRRRAAFYLKNK